MNFIGFIANKNTDMDSILSNCLNLIYCFIKCSALEHVASAQKRRDMSFSLLFNQIDH